MYFVLALGKTSEPFYEKKLCKHRLLSSWFIDKEGWWCVLWVIFTTTSIYQFIFLFVNHFILRSDWKWHDYRQELSIINFPINWSRNVCHGSTDGCLRWTQGCTNIFKRIILHIRFSSYLFRTLKIYLAFNVYFAMDFVEKCIDHCPIG